MDTLPNVNTRRGGKDPSHIGLTSNVSPKVQSPQAENSHTGVSSFFVPKPNGKWFALRATYGRNQMACEELNKKEIQTYMPMHKVAKIISGKKRFVKEPLLDWGDMLTKEGGPMRKVEVVHKKLSGGNPVMIMSGELERESRCTKKTIES